MSTRRRALWAALGLLSAVALVAGTWMAASRFQSPAQRTAAAQPPVAQPVLVPVTRGDLTERTTVSATASPAQTRDLTLPLPNGAAVVTASGVAAGTDLSSGQVVTWVNDRPVIALNGGFPLYRDLVLGDTGTDVRLLQQALADLGYAITPDGSFGAVTAACLTELYQNLGSKVPTRQVEKTPAVGTALAAATASLSLSSGNLTLIAPATGAVAVRLKEGLTGTAQLGADSVPVRVSAVTAAAASTKDGASADPSAAPAQDQGAAGAGGSTVSLEAAGGSFPAAWSGHKDVLVTLNLTEPLSKVLTVPQRALATSADGTTSVLLQRPDGTFEQVAVTQTACVGGVCAIKELEAGSALTEGSQVWVDR